MPGMRLDFLKNTSQRAASGKAMPLKQVEAVLLYGRPEQRAKVVQKLLPNTYALCLSKDTHHLLLTLLEKCDGLTRVQMLYHLRRKILDLSLSPVGNVVVQEMLQRLPSQQQREIAETFVLNAETDELKRLCEHSFGNHVAQKMMELPAAREVLEECFLPFISSLAVHPFGQRVVAKFIDSAEDGWRCVMMALFGTAEGNVPEERIAPMFARLHENMAISALLRHPMVPNELKDAVCAHLGEYAADYLRPSEDVTECKDEFALPDFGNAVSSAASLSKHHPKKTGNGKEKNGAPVSSLVSSRHHHAYITIFEKGDLAQRKELWSSIASTEGLIEHLVLHKAAIGVAVAAFKTLPEAQQNLWDTLFIVSANDRKTSMCITDVAQDSVRTMLLRAVIEVRGDLLTKTHRQQLAKVVVELSQNPVSSPVLQKLVECFADDTALAQHMLRGMKSDLRTLVMHSSASFFVQAMLQYGSSEIREELVKELLSAFKDLREMLAFAQGSHVMQKLVAYASDDAVVAVVEQLLSEAKEEVNAEANEHTDDGFHKDDEVQHADHDNANKDEHDDDDEKEDEEHDETDGVKATPSSANTSDAEETKPNDETPETKPLSRRAQRDLNRAKHYAVTSRAILSYALHQHACYVIQALLRECRGRRLDALRRRLMRELKPFVFDLAVSPWAGRVVLEAMMQCGSAPLAEAMRHVVFLRAEAWLSGESAAGQKRGGGLDPTMRQTLRRAREETDEAEGKKPRKKLYRTFKK